MQDLTRKFKNAIAAAGSVVRYLLIGIVRAYQLMISPYFPMSCRYHPTCSRYAIEAISIHGAVKGTWLAGRRLLRCHPWSEGGEDPVPEKRLASRSGFF